MKAVFSQTLEPIQDQQMLQCKLGQDLEAIVLRETERNANALHETSKHALDTMAKGMVGKIQAMLLASLACDKALQEKVAVLQYLFDREHFEMEKGL